MIRLIRYECFKLFYKRAILVMLILFSVLNWFKIDHEYKSYSYLSDGQAPQSWNRAYWQLYEDYSGTITDEKIARLLARYQPLAEATADMTASTRMNDPDTLTGNRYSDRNLLEKYFVNPIRYFYGYHASAVQVAEKARENVSLYQARGQLYEARKNSVIYHLYQDRAIPVFAYQELYHYYLNYDFSTVLILLLCLYGIVGTFVCEKETQMDLLLLTHPNGGRKTALAKIVAVSLFAICVSLWFSVLDFVGFACSFGTLEGGGLPLYAIKNFAEASVTISLFSYALLSAALKAIGVWALAMLLLVLSLRWSTARIPFALNLAVLLALTVSGASVAHTSNLWLKVINPYSLLTNRILMGKTEFLNIAGYPILSGELAVAFAMVIGLVATLAIICLSAHNQHCTTGRNV